MSNKEQIENILSMDLPKEVKEKLLTEIAKGIENSKTEEKDFETKRQELIEKNKKHVEEVKQNIEKRNYDYDVNYKTEILSRIKHPKKDYYLHKKSDLEQLTGTEILAIYDMYKQNNPEMLEEARNLYQQDKEMLKNKPKKEIDESKKQGKANNPKSSNTDLEELANKMTITEMNTILNMLAASKKDDKILNDIATRLGIAPDKLEEIAKLKKEQLENKEKSNQEDTKTSESENQNKNPEDESSESKEEEQIEDQDKAKEQEGNGKGANSETPKPDLEPEKPKKVTKITKAKDLLKNKINASVNKTKAIIAVAALAAVAISVATFGAGTILTAGAGAALAKTASDFNKGRKM